MAPNKPPKTQKTTLFSFFSKKKKEQKKPKGNEVVIIDNIGKKTKEVITGSRGIPRTDNNGSDVLEISPGVQNCRANTKKRLIIKDDEDEDEDEDVFEASVSKSIAGTSKGKTNAKKRLKLNDEKDKSESAKGTTQAKPKSKEVASGWSFLNGDTTFSTKAKSNKKRKNDTDDSSHGHLKEPYEAGKDLPILCNPQDMFDDMVLKSLCDNGRSLNLLKPLVNSLHERSLKIATMCSGTESPVLALDMIYKAIEDACDTFDVTIEGATSTVRPSIRCEHVFSCEIEPFKQSYIERNFQPPILFRDIRELGNEKAHTAFGSFINVPNTPGCVDILVAGTSCVDYSNLNNKKKKMEELGESGQTFQGMLDWIGKARPTIVIIENVYGAPWDEKVSIFQKMGYAATFLRLDSKDYYIPQTRQRGYLFAILKGVKGSMDKKRTNGWEKMMKNFERPASAALDAFMLPNDDARVLRGRARLCKESSVGSSGESRAARTDWVKCEGRHVFARSNEDLGEKRPFTGWSESSQTQCPGFCWNDWVNSQVNRVHDLLDINTLRLARSGVDNTYKTMIWNLSQNVDRDIMGRFNLSGCLTPTGIPYVTNRGGPLVGEELLLLQGIPADDLLLTKESEKNLKDLSGNAMTTTVVGACILSALLQGHEALRDTQLKTGSMIIPSLVPRPLISPSEIIITQKYGSYSCLPLYLGRKKSTQNLDELCLEGWKSARKCINEGSDVISPFVECQDCGHTASIAEAFPVKNYEKHNYKKDAEDLERIYPYKFRTKLLSALPTVLKFSSFEIESIEKPEGIKSSLWDEWKRRVDECTSHEFRLSKLVRRQYWHAEYKSAKGNCQLTFTLHRNSAEWLLFAEAPAKHGPLREFLERPVVRVSISASSKSILSGMCQVRLPITTKTKVTIKACGNHVDSWRRRIGLKGNYEKEVQFEKLEIICSTFPEIEGMYDYLPHCGGACGSLHKKQVVSQDKIDPMFFFLESGRSTMPKNDTYSFATSFHRTEYKEYREIILRIDEKERFSPVFDTNPWQSKELSALTNGQWLSMDGVAINEEIHKGASFTVPDVSSLAVPMVNNGWKWATEIVSFRVPMDENTDDLLKSCIARGTLDLNLRKSKRCFSDLAFITARLDSPLQNKWFTLEAQDAEHDVCLKCAPPKPDVVWKLISKGKKQMFMPFEDWKQSAAYEVSLKERPQIWNVRLSADVNTSSSLRVQIGLNVFSLCQRAYGIFPLVTWPRQAMIKSNAEGSNCSFEWRVVMHTEKSSANFDKFTFTSNKKDIESEQPPNFLKYPLRKEQSRSLKWMLNQERSNLPFFEEEICENILPSVNWRAEGRVRRPVLVRGGCIADEVGYGKTAITLACIDSNSALDLQNDNVETPGFVKTKATLVVVPGHLMGQWPNEVKKFLGSSKNVVEIKDMRSFNDTSIDDILDADIVIVNFTVLCSDKYYARLGLFVGKHKCFPSGAKGGRHFESVYESCLKSLPNRVEQIKNDCGSAFETIEKEVAKYVDPQEQDATTFRLDGKKAVYKNTGKTESFTRKCGIESIEDPWKLRKEKNFKNMRCPPLEIFKWKRVVVDEFTYLLEKPERRRPLSVVQKGIMADYRWVLSGTPSHESFDDIKCLAKLLNIHLGVEELLPGSENGSRSNNERTGAENMSQFLENKSIQWHERRRVIAQSFLDRFVRQNIAEIDEIPCTENVVTVMPTPLERAIYLELETYLKNLSFNSQAAKMSRKKSQYDRENRMQKVLEHSKSSEEALLKCCAHFNVTGDGSTALNTLEEIIARRVYEKNNLKNTIISSVAEAIRQQNKIEKEQPGWVTLKKHDKGEMLNALARYFSQIETNSSVPGGADVEIGMTLKELVSQAKKKAIVDPEGDATGCILNSNEGSDDGNKKRKVTPGDKGKGTSDEDADSSDARVFSMKKKLRDDITYIQGLGKELCGRVRSLRYIEEIRRLQQREKPTIFCVGCDKDIKISETAISSCCGHIGCYQCLKYCAQNESCIVKTCSARISFAHVVRSTKFTLNSTDVKEAKDGSKLSKMIDTIKMVTDDGDRMIIFAQFEDLIQRISKTLEDNGIKTVQVKGRVEEQVKRLKPFQAENPSKNDPRVLLLRMDDEQSAGLNLTQLNHVLFVHPLLASSQQQYDAYETQAIGRVRRFGQQKNVFVWRFLVTDTIDTEIYGKRSGRPLNVTTSIQCNKKKM